MEEALDLSFDRLLMMMMIIYVYILKKNNYAPVDRGIDKFINCISITIYYSIECMRIAPLCMQMTLNKHLKLKQVGC